VEVTNNGISTTNILAWVTKYAPGAFTYTQDGITFAAAMDAKGAPVLPKAPAKPGDILVMYATGLEPSTAGVLSPEHLSVNGVSVEIGDQAATVQFAGLVGPGLFQINFVVPKVAAGNQPISIESHSTNSPAGVMIPIGSK
jgi:uncharacterized protein (TIGR03437 family)